MISYIVFGVFILILFIYCWKTYEREFEALLFTCRVVAPLQVLIALYPGLKYHQWRLDTNGPLLTASICVFYLIIEFLAEQFRWYGRDSRPRNRAYWYPYQNRMQSFLSFFSFFLWLTVIYQLFKIIVDWFDLYSYLS